MKYIHSMVLAVLLGAVISTSSHVYAATPAGTGIPVMEKTAPQQAEMTPAPTSASGQTQIEYALPYPGILPDHPLYFFKNIRDQILERLISDPTRKTEFYILQSDKALSASIFLASQSKAALALDMISQSRSAKEKAVAVVTSLKSEGKDVPTYVAERLQKSFAKQAEVISNMLPNVNAETKSLLMKTLESLQKLQGDAGLSK